MRALLYTVLFFAIAIQVGCKKDSMCNCTQSTGNSTTETRSAQPFTHIDLADNIDLVIHIDTFYQIKVTAGAHLLDGVKTEVKNNTLYLSNINRCNWLRSFKNSFTVDVWLPSLEEIYVNDASGNIDCADTLKQNLILNSGSSTGDYHLKLNCSTATLALHTGPADLYVTGHIGVTYAYSSGYGTIDMSETDSDDIYISNLGTNDLYIKANKRIDAQLSYLGNIYYRGNPSQVDEKYTNSGRLINIK